MWDASPPSHLFMNDIVIDTVKRISMRGTKFTCEMTHYGYVILAVCPVLDSIDNKTIIHRHCAVSLAHSDIPPSEDKIIDICHKMMLSQYEHEVDELFNLDGKPIFQPHRSWQSGNYNKRLLEA